MRLVEQRQTAALRPERTGRQRDQQHSFHIDHLAGHAAVDDEIGAGDEAGALAVEEPEDDLGDVLRLADAAGRVLRMILAAQCALILRLDPAGTDAVDAEPGQWLRVWPFPTHVPDLMPQRFAPEDEFKFPPIIGSPSCEAQLSGLRNDGLYTPPSTQGTVIFPMTGGGVNWGGAAFDPVNQILYANTSYAVHLIKLIPRTEAEALKPPPGVDFGPQIGAPFAVMRVVALSKLGLLCNKPPWGTLVAVDLKAGKSRPWRRLDDALENTHQCWLHAADRVQCRHFPLLALRGMLRCGH